MTKNAFWETLSSRLKAKGLPTFPQVLDEAADLFDEAATCIRCKGTGLALLGGVRVTCPMCGGVGRRI